MNPVAQVSDYEQWARGANRGHTVHLATAAFTTAAAEPEPQAPPQAASKAAPPDPQPAQPAQPAEAPQLSAAQVDNDQRYHTYYYRPRCDPVSTNYYYAWPRQSGQYSSQYYYPAFINNPYGYHHNWYGRTASEVYNDNLAYAERNHHRSPRRVEQEMVPRDPGDDQMFWVRELDGNWTLRSYNTIENDLRPGRWDKYHGRVHFIRTRD